MKAKLLMAVLFVNTATLPMDAQTFSTIDSLALLAIDAACDASGQLNWNTEPNPANWSGITWYTDTPKRVQFIEVNNKSLTGTMDVTSLSEMTELWCNGNQLTGIDLSGLTNLNRLMCRANQLTRLDLSSLTSLQGLYCENNQIDSLDVSSVVGLVYITCFNNQLSDLNLSGLTSLVELNCSNNQLTSLNLSGCTNLVSLYCSNNQLNRLDLTGLSNLTTLFANDNQLTTYDFSALTSVTTLTCYKNKIPLSSLATALHIEDLYYEPMDTIFSSVLLAGTYLIDYSGESHVGDSVTTFVFHKDDMPVDTNNTGLYTTNGPGIYFCKISNGYFPGLVLTTATITMTGETPVVSVSPSEIYMEAAENSSGIFTITSNTAWTISGLEPWLTNDRSSGLLDDTITITATANPDTSSRLAVVTISSTGVTPQTITVTQEATPYLIASATELSVNAASNSIVTFDIASNGNWIVESTQTWLTPDPISGSKWETVTLTAGANPDYATRSAVVTISADGLNSQTINVTQAGKAPLALSPAMLTGINIYPNPVEDIVTVLLEQEDSPSTISIYNLDGTQFMQLKTNDSHTEIDMAEYSSGVYILRIATSGIIFDQKIIKY